MIDSELLALVGNERQASVGFDHDSELLTARETALNYYKGYMPDLPALPNRSRVVSTDVADTIDTLHPDVVEILAGGEDVVSFTPIGAEDEDAARQETDSVKHVFFNENPGWQTIYDMTKDAMQSKIGVAKAWVEECPEETESFEGKTPEAIQLASKTAEVVDIKPAADQDPENPQLFDFTVRRQAYRRVRIASWPPEDFTVASDTVGLHDEAFTYCAGRSRPRAQDLVAQGFDAKKVAELSFYGRDTDDGVAQARDTAGEHDYDAGAAQDVLRRVEIVEHIIKINEGKKTRLWSVITGENETVLLQKTEVRRNPFNAITPYPVTHRFYGESVADRLIEPQRAKTALRRMMFDSGYYAMNARNEVDESGANENTIPDLLRNEPGVPVRVKRAGTVNPIQAGVLTFDVLAAMEYEETRVEQRTGVVRAAQGLTPDTLHETAKGALALLTAAQKRTKLMARTWAETGIKDLYLTVHGLLRENSDRPLQIRLGKDWLTVDPTTWGNRSDMTIEIGLGASGREADLMMLQAEGEAMEKIVALQAGAQGPIVTMEHVFNQYERTLTKLGNKTPEKFGQNPKDAPPQPPKPDPAMAEIEGKLKLQEQEMQGKGQLQAMELQGKGMLEQAKLRQAEEAAIRDHELKVAQMQAEIQLKRDIAAEELALKRELLSAELQMKRELNAQQAQIARENNQERNFIQRETNSAKIDAQVNVGGDPG